MEGFQSPYQEFRTLAVFMLHNIHKLNFLITNRKQVDNDQSFDGEQANNNRFNSVSTAAVSVLNSENDVHDKNVESGINCMMKFIAEGTIRIMLCYIYLCIEKKYDFFFFFFFCCYKKK